LPPPESSSAPEDEGASPRGTEERSADKPVGGNRMAEKESPAYVPQMLMQLEDELARSRKREAFWISVVVHILLALAILFLPQFLPKWARPHLLQAEDLANAKEPTFLALPKDAQKPPPKVKSDRLSDKNRRAQSNRPRIPRKTLDQLRDGRLAGKPLPPGPPAAMPALPSLALPRVGEPPAVARQEPKPPSASQPESATGEMPKLQPPAEKTETPGKITFPAPSSAGSLIAKASRAPRPSYSAKGGGGDQYGLGTEDRNITMGPFNILSDTQGVDFGPYLSRVLQSIKSNWYNLVPEEARPPLMKHGRVSIRFLITPSGKVSGLYIDRPSGDSPLDRAAYGGITASDPFSPLPEEFHGPYLALRITFFYNPRPGEMEQEP
jgi:TonB family protein